MTRILVQRTSGSSSSNHSQNRSSSSSSSAAPPPPPPPPLPPPSLRPSVPIPSQSCVEEEERESIRNFSEAGSCGDGLEISSENPKSREMDESVKELPASEIGFAGESNVVGSGEYLASGLNSVHLAPDERSRNMTSSNLGGFEHGQAGLDLCGASTNSSNGRSITNSGFKREISAVELGVFGTVEKSVVKEDNAQFSSSGSSQKLVGCSCPPPPPVPPPKPWTNSSSRRIVPDGSSTLRSGTSRWPSWAFMASRTSSSGSRPSSPRSYGEGEGYNSADEQSPCFVSSYDDAERERIFEMDIRRSKGFEVRRMAADGNCLFRAVADQVYGDAEMYDVTRQMCIDYLEKERDHFSQFVTESFTAYCKRKRRDKVYGNNTEIQAMSEMYNRPIHIYSYSTEPINIFHGSYKTDSPPIRLSYHRGNHYNSLVDPHQLTIGAGLGFSSLQGTNIDKDQVKAAIKAQQDQQIENALLAEGRLYSDLELTEKEIERMVMEASRAEYLAAGKYRQQFGYKESSTSAGAEPSSSGATTGSSGMEFKSEFGFTAIPDSLFTSSVHMLLSMGFSYLRAVEAYSIFGDDVDSMVCYLLETGTGSPGRENMHRMKGKAAEK